MRFTNPVSYAEFNFVLASAQGTKRALEKSMQVYELLGDVVFEPVSASLDDIRSRMTYKEVDFDASAGASAFFAEVAKYVRPHSSWRRGHADCKALSVLAVSSLRERHVPARLALFHPEHMRFEYFSRGRWRVGDLAAHTACHNTLYGSWSAEYRALLRDGYGLSRPCERERSDYFSVYEQLVAYSPAMSNSASL